MTSIIIMFALKLGEFLIDRFNDNLQMKRAMQQWIRDLQSNGIGTSKLHKKYEELLKRYEDDKPSQAR